MKKHVLVLTLAGIFSFAGTAWAVPFPDKSPDVLQDEAGIVQQEDRERFAEAVKAYPESYKVVIVESTRPEAEHPDEYAQKLYDNYNLSENTLMIVLDMESQELGVYAGPALTAKGADPEMLQEKIAAYYEPFRTQQAYLKGIELFVAEVSAELNRLSAGGEAAGPVASAGTSVPQAAEQQKKSVWSAIPWWLYGGVTVLAVGGITGGILLSRRRTVYGEIDDLEDAKDTVVEKIHQLVVDKPLRRTSGATEERYAALADRKENLLRIRIPDVEMIILEAEEACDRFRFAMARGLLAEGRQLLRAIEQEMQGLKNEAESVVQTKKENRIVLPEIGKSAEAAERKLSHYRLEYGQPFHQLKLQLDEVDRMRREIKTALADGDEVKAHELAAAAQDILSRLNGALERLPELVIRVTKEMHSEWKQLEADIAAAAGDGYDLDQNYLDASLLQVKQLYLAAVSALEEGDTDLIETHAKAFEIKVDAIYQAMEEAVLSHRQAAVAEAPAPETTAGAERLSEDGYFLDNVILTNEADRTAQAGLEANTPLHREAGFPAEDLHEATDPLPGQADLPAQAILQADPYRPTEAAVQEVPEAATRGDVIPSGQTAVREEPDLPMMTEAVERDRDDEWHAAVNSKPQERDEERGWEAVTPGEREWLLSPEPKAAFVDDWALPPERRGEATENLDAASWTGRDGEESEEIEYELVIPKRREPDREPEPEPESVADELALELIIESEQDVLDEMERISNALVRIRQRIKRSYLPGVPDQVKLHFDQVVQALAQTQQAMDRFGYDWNELALLLKDAYILLAEAERVTERVIAACQRAEGAIQYTNRYRRINRRVNELLSQAEHAFRQLRFDEALELAEEARLLVEGDPEDKGDETNRWLLRRKQKGAGS